MVLTSHSSSLWMPLPLGLSQSMDWMMDEMSENIPDIQQQRACFAEAHLRPHDVNLESLDHQFLEATITIKLLFHEQ